MNLDTRSIRAAVIDLDGTLVDTLGDFAAVLNRVLADLKLPAVDRPTVGRLVGKGTEHLIRSVLAQLGASPALYEQAHAQYQETYLEVNGRHSEVYAGVLEGLAQLRAQGIALACVTNKPTRFAQALLQDKGLSSYFAVVFGGDAFERKKPDPLPLLKACEALGSASAATLMVGDSSNDAQAARAAGCPVVLVTYGYNHGEPIRAVDADAFIDSLAALPPMLRPACPAGRP